MYRRTPWGLFDERAPADGVAPHAGARIPGPHGTATDEVSRRSARSSDSVVDGQLTVSFAVGDNRYRLRHVDADGFRNSNEAAVPPEEAAAILERAVAHHHKEASLVRVLERATSRLAGLHTGGIYVLVWIRPLPAFERVAASSPAPPLRARSEPSSEPPAETEELTMAAVQAAVLKAAAAAGLPFCEECARKVAQRILQSA